MVKIDKYDDEFCNEFYKCVDEHLLTEDKTVKDKKSRTKDKEQRIEQLEQRIVGYSNKLFKKSIGDFKELILMPYKEIEKNYLYMKINDKQTEHIFTTYKPDFDEMIGAYKRVVESTSNKIKMNVRMVNESKLYVCPYCNRSYISSRGEEVSGAQLDHFFPKSAYPIFELCLYNLVSSCGDCNRVKSKSTVELISPFDYTVDWNKIKFSYEPINTQDNKITINTSDLKMKNNINEMKIEEAYQIHGEEVNRLTEKKMMYEKSQIEEFDEMLKKINITQSDYKELIFGPQITDDMLKKMPLGKLKRDLMNELEIYK